VLVSLWAAQLALLLVAPPLLGQTMVLAPQPMSATDSVPQRSVGDWLLRMHQASTKRAYIGTFVVSAGGSMASARIWHVCDGEQQMERVESLTGAPRSTFRHNDQVLTFLPENRVAVSERRESLGLFPNLLQAVDSSIAQFYSVRELGHERVAGLDADVLELQARDGFRFGYRIWSERKSGLVIKVQTLDAQLRVLEQAAFSELQLDAPVSMNRLLQMMSHTEGYQIERPEMVKTTAEGEGWVLKRGVPGFKPMSCYRRQAAGVAAPRGMLHWIFSDGLATVSLFAELAESGRQVQAGSTALGATHTLTRRIGDWWLTVVGEVPAQTLLAFSQGLERKN
jgi:sigma-E factor negative regulatory protein RseB